MAEVPEKRMSTRNRGEPPLKKRALTPPPPPRPPKATPAVAPPKPLEVKEEGLPIKLTEGRPIPTLTEPQDGDVSSKTFQSIAESGVLAASIERSRQRWLTDGVFERYWIRPSKKNPKPEQPNPPKETMSRLGVCSMIIEPHVFDITLYTVKDLPTAPVPYPNQPPPPSHYSPFVQNPSYSPPVYNGPFTGTTERVGSHQNPLPPFHEGFGRLGPHGPPLIYQTSPPAAPPSGPPPPPIRRTSTGNPSSPNKTADPQSDPVIQILATRAASDHALKNLMKVVASGQASPDQLKEFQNHIDEINTTLKSGRSSEVQKGAEHPKAPTPDDPLPSVEAHSSPPVAHAHPVALHTPQNHSGPPIKAEPLPQIYPPPPHPLPMQPKSRPLITAKPDIHSVVFDFSSTGDRFLLPRFSILEYLPGNAQVVVSFLVIRRGSQAVSGHNYKKTQSYYQPVTLRLSTPNSRTLEPIARVVAPPDEVRRYMDNVFDKMQPAEGVFLATRLPRTKDGEEDEKEDVVEKKDGELLKASYEPPSSLVPLVA